VPSKDIYVQFYTISFHVEPVFVFSKLRKGRRITLDNLRTTALDSAHILWSGAAEKLEILATMSR
jgi:hypothetical protein